MYARTPTQSEPEVSTLDFLAEDPLRTEVAPSPRSSVGFIPQTSRLIIR